MRECKEELFLQYLLGGLTDAEQVRVEDRAFSDTGYLAALEAAEADLIDAYVRGELKEADRRAFERRFLTSPGRMRKVEFAFALARASDEAPPLASPTSVWLQISGWIRRWQFAMALAGAAAAVVAWLVIDNSGLRSRIAALEADRRMLAEVRPQVPHTDSATPLVASLTLMGGLSRAASNVDELVLRQGISLAHIVIQLEAHDDYPRFRVDLCTRDGRNVLTADNLRPASGAAGNTVTLDVPASLLPDDTYELGLKGLARQETREVGYNYFRVVRRSE